jgi:ATP-binding cassette subfamily C (CFTR/MRP) protein 1
VYSRQKVLILDDVFSGLDAISEDRIFSRLFGKSGLLRTLGTTILLVTNAAHRLSYADYIIVLTAQGTVSEQGKFEDLAVNNGYVAGLTVRRRSEVEDVSKDGTALVKTKIDDDVARQNAAANVHRPIGSWAIYKYYFKSVGWRNVGVWTGLMIVYSTILQFPGRLVPILV